MAGIYIGSTDAFAGKNLIAIGLGLTLQKHGHNVGYFKPVGERPKVVEESTGDEDAIILQEVLGSNAAPSTLTPVIVPRNLRAAALASCGTAMEKVEAAYKALSQNHDTMLVGGLGSMAHTGKHCYVDGLSIVQSLGLRTILVDRYHNGQNFDAVLSLHEQLGNTLAGVIFNDVPEHFMRDAEEILIPFLQEQGVQVLGIIPRHPALNAIKASELAWQLEGKIISGNSQSQRSIEDFLIGTMQVENFMTYFRQHRNAAVIVGGDRTDLQLVALEGGCNSLILTGNITPSELIHSRSEALGIPVIQVTDDTYTIAKRMESILGSQKLRELNKIKLAATLFTNALDYKSLMHSLELSS